MAKTNARTPNVTRTVTHEGAPAWSVGCFDELKLTAASTFLGEDTFYETAEARRDRLRVLVYQCVQRNDSRTGVIIMDLRIDHKIRHAALLCAIEYQRSGGRGARQIIDAVCQRPDEPAELLAIWQSLYGSEDRRNLRKLPWAIRRGLADAATRLYTEKAWLKYGQNRKAAISMADVIELTHPKPTAPWQSELFRYILDDAHGPDAWKDYAERVKPNAFSADTTRLVSAPALPLISQSYTLGQVPEADRRAALRTWGADGLADAGYTWERLAGWLPGGLDSDAWEAIIPNMGVMALLRNLRNFDAAGISEHTQRMVEAKITSLDDVQASRIFPYHVLSAYRMAPSDRWKHPLATTLDLASGNVPRWDRTLFLVDVSGSMTATLSKRSKVRRCDVGAVMALSALKVSTSSDLVLFATESMRIEMIPGASVLGATRETLAANGLEVGLRTAQALGWGTFGHSAIGSWFDPARHERVVIFTDDQQADSADLSAHVPQIIYFNLAGYAPQSDWRKRRIHVGGFSDAAFNLAAEISEGLR